MFLEVPILSLGVLPLLLLPLPGQLRARNVAVITLVTTLFLVNLIRGINAVYSTPYMTILSKPNYVDHLGE